MRIKIETPTKLIDSVIFMQESGFSLTYEGDEFFLSGEATEQELLAALDAHNPPAPTEPTVAEKLASIGLSVADLKEELGL
jgi:hypothetical protein